MQWKISSLGLRNRIKNMYWKLYLTAHVPMAEQKANSSEMKGFFSLDNHNPFVLQNMIIRGRPFVLVVIKRKFFKNEGKALL